MKEIDFVFILQLIIAFWIYICINEFILAYLIAFMYLLFEFYFKIGVHLIGSYIT